MYTVKTKNDLLLQIVGYQLRVKKNSWRKKELCCLFVYCFLCRDKMTKKFDFSLKGIAKNGGIEIY